MEKRKEYQYAEIRVDKLFLESFSDETSAYHRNSEDLKIVTSLDKFRSKLKWHIKRSLSKRQKEVIEYYLVGKTEREIAQILGVTQQVVNIYKHRAIKKLHKIITN